MHIQENVRALRSELFAMFRLSQRALDYSTKAYQLRSSEFCRHVGQAEDEAHRLNGSIADRAQTLLHSGLLLDTEMHFVSFALRIGCALQITYDAATGMAQTTMCTLERGRTTASPAIEKVGQLVNRLMRLCIVALANQEIQYARMVLQTAESEEWVYLAAYKPPPGSAQRIDPETPFEFAIRKNLDQIARQVFAIAGAIACWLEEDRSITSDCVSAVCAHIGVHARSANFRENKSRDNRVGQKWSPLHLGT